MIERLTGTLIEVDLTSAVVDVQGVGYAVTVPMSTYDRLPRAGSAVTLLTHFHIREDAMQLFGFATKEERALFRMLITVSGVGPRIALNILSSMPVASFCTTVVEGDLKALCRVNGLGKKSAERLVIELRERVRDIEPSAGLGGQPAAAFAPEAQDAVAGLATLGFKQETARTTVEALCRELPEGQRSAENLIRMALQKLNS